MTDIEALVKFFQAKQIPPKLWIFWDQMLQFSFSVAHVPGTEILGVDYLSRLIIELQQRVYLKLTDNMPVYHIKIDLA